MISDSSGQLRNNMAPGYDPLDPWNLKGAATYVANVTNGRRIMMVDFNKLKEDSKKRAALESAGNGSIRIGKTNLEVINELLEIGMTEWSNNFLLSVKEWLKRKEGNYLSPKQQAKLEEIAAENDIVWTKEVTAVAVPRSREQIKMDVPDYEEDPDSDIPF